MEELLLFTPDQLPIPDPIPSVKSSWVSNVVKQSRKVVEELRAKMQLNLDFLLNKPVLKGRRRKVENRRFDESGEFIFSSDKSSCDTSYVFTSEWIQAHKSELKDWFRNDTTVTSQVLTERWMQESVVDMHCWVLSESIEALAAAENPEEKMDILEWIFSPSYIERLGKTHDGRTCIIRRHASDIPFSFMNCCRAFGMSDPESFREMLVEQMSDEFRPQLQKYLQIHQRATY